MRCRRWVGRGGQDRPPHTRYRAQGGLEGGGAQRPSALLDGGGGRGGGRVPPHTGAYPAILEREAPGGHPCPGGHQQCWKGGGWGGRQAWPRLGAQVATPSGGVRGAHTSRRPPALVDGGGGGVAECGPAREPKIATRGTGGEGGMHAQKPTSVVGHGGGGQRKAAPAKCGPARDTDWCWWWTPRRGWTWTDNVNPTGCGRRRGEGSIDSTCGRGTPAVTVRPTKLLTLQPQRGVKDRRQVNCTYTSGQVTSANRRAPRRRPRFGANK